MLPFKGNKKITSQSTLKQLPMLKINGKQWGNGNIQFGSSLRGSFGNYEKKAQRNFCINQKAERERERERVSFNSTHAHTERPQFSGRQSAIFSTVKSFSLSLSKHSFSWISFFCFHQSHWFFSFCFFTFFDFLSASLSLSLIH